MPDGTVRKWKTNPPVTPESIERRIQHEKYLARNFEEDYVIVAVRKPPAPPPAGVRRSERIAKNAQNVKEEGTTKPK